MAAEIGGPPAVVAGLTAALAARGHQVTVATIKDGDKPTIPVDARVRLQECAPDGPSLGRYAKSAALDAWLRGNAGRFDIVHIHSIWQFPTFAAARACWSAKVPYIVLLHGMLDAYSVNQRSRHIKRLYWLWRERRVEGRAAALHCLNAAEIRRAVPWIAEMPKFIAGNGIDEELLRTLPARGGFRGTHPEFAERPLALFLSRIHPKKGLDRLIPAWKAVAEKCPEARLLIAGAGDAEYVEAMRKLAAESGLSTQVHFLGQITGRAKWELLVDSDLFVLPSYQEGFSMAITEALAAGAVPVVTEECNFDELEPGMGQAASGVIVRKGDMGAFTQAVVALFGDGPRRQQLAVAGRELVAARFTWQTIAAQIESVYRHIGAKRRFSPDGSLIS
jgi:glycosyltransferase involved in cell wall biosynthesis